MARKARGGRAEAEAAAMTAAQMFAAHALRLAAEYDRQRAAILATDEPEATHRARVALRRMRSLVEGFSPVIASKAEARLARRLRDAFRALGPLRDADVRALALAATPEGEALAAAAAALRDDLRETLRAGDGPGLEAEVAALLGDPRFWREAPHRQRLAAAPAGVLAQRALQVAWTDALAYGDDLAALDTEDRHDFRKDMKTLRYLSEFFAPLWPGGGQRDFLARMQKLQDALGTLNDIATLLHPAEGEAAPDLAGKLAAEEREAMEKAAKHWRKLRLAGPWWHREAAGGEG